MSAIDRFNEGVTEVNRLLNADPSHQADLPTPIEDGIRASNASRLGATIRRAAVVLLVSHFEGYLRSIAEEAVDALGDGTLSSRQIPAGIREAHVVPKLTAIVQCNDPRQRMALIGKLATISSLWSDAAKPPPGTLEAQAITRKIHSAESSFIDSLFATLGAVDSVCDGDIDIRDDQADIFEVHTIRTRLTDIVKCRNDIAHGDIDRQPTAEDVRRYVLFLQHFARRLSHKAEGLISLCRPSSIA